MQHGFGLVKTALVAGTYHDPSGIFFGGQELQKSHVLVREFLKQALPGCTLQRHVAWCDVHTGLGPCGVDVLLGSGLDAAELSSMFPRVPVSATVSSVWRRRAWML